MRRLYARKNVWISPQYINIRRHNASFRFPESKCMLVKLTGTSCRIDATVTVEMHASAIIGLTFYLLMTLTSDL